jgi:hypothetical protein
LPLNAWERLIELPQFLKFDGPHVGTVHGSWIVYAAWPLAGALVALIAVGRRDL